MSKRILIATATAGAGHVQAVAAIEEAWQLRLPKNEVKRVDILEFTPTLYRKVEEFHPDVVVCPHFLPLEAMGVRRFILVGDSGVPKDRWSLFTEAKNIHEF